MKIPHTLIALSLAMPFGLRADDEKKPAETPKTEAAAESKEAAKEVKDSPADVAWKEVETLLKGPKERFKTMEEASPIYQKHYVALDEKTDAFVKAYPEDVRRWKVKLNKIASNNSRKIFGAKTLTADELAKVTAEILASPDAEKEVKGAASFYSTAFGDQDEADYPDKVTAHKAAYPDFPGNKQLDSLVESRAKFAARKGKPVAISFTSTTGEEISIEKLKGKVVLVDFWATWCGPCVAELPNVIETYKKHHGSGFEIVGISFDREKDKLEKMTKEKGMTWPQYFEAGENGKPTGKNKYGEEFGIQGIPTMWIINKKGELVFSHGGANLEKKVEKLLAE